MNSTYHRIRFYFVFPFQYLLLSSCSIMLRYVSAPWQTLIFYGNPSVSDKSELPFFPTGNDYWNFFHYDGKSFRFCSHSFYQFVNSRCPSRYFERSDSSFSNYNYKCTEGVQPFILVKWIGNWKIIEFSARRMKVMKLLEICNWKYRMDFMSHWDSKSVVFSVIDNNLLTLFNKYLWIFFEISLLKFFP